ncbi:copper resistance protein CopC [Kutzneria viridogrisea]|uniref:CopC domain-containing protein n=2 Tax=Kutzneria TaxID=43356 RepID=W5VYN4_9PSEU|nr:copper resistance CopC family protein [Kutzneria albida]AHH93421.1 hypothetical protein KALB_44 [Kutzneria albida DSM 43870]MBA8929194.1 hypothetical protein [Kutzneria viridogrisea]
MKRFAVSLLLAVGAMLGLAVPAFAHNVLISSDPKDGASVEVGPSQVTLNFDLPIQAGDFNVVTVNGPGGTRWEGGAATVAGSSISAPVRPLGAAGEYTVGYRILSADGHPVSGAVKFTLSKAGTGTPATPSSTAAASPGASADGGGMPVWPWVVGGVLLLAVGVVVALRAGSSKEDESK